MKKLENRRTDRRDSFDEKVQKSHIESVLKMQSVQRNFALDLSEFNSISSGRNAKYITENGMIVSQSKRKRNKFYDSKTFDAMATANNLRLYFVLKSTRQGGGSQDDIPLEIGRTVDCISKNKFPTNEFIVVLDGTYWDKIDFSSLKVPHNCTVTNSRNLYESIENVLNKHSI